jgi:hypothetical protein
LALSVPLSRFTLRVGGGSAFFVRPLYMRLFFEQPAVRKFVWIIYVFTLLLLGCLIFISSNAPRVGLRGTGFLVCDVILYSEPLICLVAGFMATKRQLSILQLFCVVCIFIVSALIYTITWGSAWIH